MPKDEWGAKRVCPSCSTRFFDLTRDPMTCPNCGAIFTLDSLTAVKPKPPRAEKVKPEPVDLEDLPDIENGARPNETEDDLADEILEDEEDSVDLEELADVASDEEET